MTETVLGKGKIGFCLRLSAVSIHRIVLLHSERLNVDSWVCQTKRLEFGVIYIRTIVNSHVFQIWHVNKMF